MTVPVRVLVVDDSATSRALLAAVLARDPGITVVGEAKDGAEALAMTRKLKPSVVVMDVHMPNVDGLAATKLIMSEVPTPIVIVSASDSVRGVEAGLTAVRAGALAVAAKPSGADVGGADAERLVMLVKAFSDLRVVRQRRREPLPPSAEQPGTAATHTIEAIAVAASTGGPVALARFLGGLPADLDVPVFVVQHIAEGFIDGLASWLRSSTSLPIEVAVDGAAHARGRVYLAPSDRHLLVSPKAMRLDRRGPVGGFRPSANVLFNSIAESFGAGSAGVVLTGMGRDGRDGAGAIRRAGGMVLAQDAETSAVFGMPREVAEAGLADVVGPVSELVERIVSAAARRPSGRKG